MFRLGRSIRVTIIDIGLLYQSDRDKQNSDILSKIGRVNELA
jgi:hypothetical protein